MRVFVMFLIACHWLPTTASAETLIDNDCLGNAFETCFVLIEGHIEPGLTERLDAMLDNGIDGRMIYFNSPGGTLGEALRLGRWLRANAFDTGIGGSDGIPRWEDGSPRFMGSEGPSPGRCESACAYAFMGGVARYLDDDDKLGLHQFHAPGQQIGGEVAQKFSGELVSYMVEMGVDARIFTLASGQTAQGMTYVSRDQAAEFDLVTEDGYGAFFLEPYRDGVIAASRRLDPPGPYSGVDQISFYCRGGNAFALLHAAIHGLTEDSQGMPSVYVDGRPLSVPDDALSFRVDGLEAYLTLELSRDQATLLSQAQYAVVGAGFGRVHGGQYAAALELSDMDRRMIAAAFRFCID